MALAIFDLDNTLIAGDSDHAWGEFIARNGLVDAATYTKRNDWFYQQYQSGVLDIRAYLEFALEPLAGKTEKDLAELHRQFMTESIEPLRLTAADALLDRHRANGDYILIVTSTNAFITRPIARWLGVDDILATIPERVDGVYTGKVDGVPCFGAGKITHLDHWMQTHEYDLTESCFYSDSINDLPLLEYVGHAVAVDPDEQLAQVASDRGWTKISLRHNS